MAVHILNHPLVKHKIGLLRDNEISTKDFREISSEIARFLIYEATKDLETKKQIIKGWAGEVEVETIKGKKITVVPILRAGLGMLDAVLDLIPGAKVSVVGFFRNEKTLEPVQYYVKLASEIDKRMAIILDPMLATGGTLLATIDLLKKAGCKNICGIFLVGAPEGLEKVKKLHPDVNIYLAALDEKLNQNGYILPGLGDAGDKIFGTK